MCRILMVDDEEQIREVLVVNCLTDVGYSGIDGGNA